MNDISAKSDSILGIINAIDKKQVLLPEFQRDFRWEMERTYDLFDSLARGIFIGTIIYGKPSFAISCRELDMRPRRGRGSRAKLKIIHFTDEDIDEKIKTDNFRLILDGQQRITSLYRAIKGKDRVFLILKDTATKDSQIEESLDYFAGDQREDRISVNLHHVYQSDQENWRESMLLDTFLETRFARVRVDQWNQDTLDTNFEVYLKAVNELKDLLKREKLVAYYLLDMGLDKFTLFFERSNSRGIQLNFTDILAAKLYSGFNLRSAIDSFEDEYPHINLNRELIIRAVAYFTSEGKDVEKNYILKSLQPTDFDTYWSKICRLYVQVLNFLSDNHFILSQSWMPSENLILPLMVFLNEIEGSGLEEEQRRFIEFWFWASIFAQRYSGASNEAMLEDASILTQVARGKTIRDSTYLTQLRSRVTDADDILSFRKKANNIYKGLLNLVNYDAQGFLDWSSRSRLTFNQPIHDHHIFPKAFIKKHYKGNFEAAELINCVANRALIPKLQNLKIGSKAPSIYLEEIQGKNPQLTDCLQSHLISEMILDPELDDLFIDFVKLRASEMFELVEKYAIEPLSTFDRYFTYTQSEQNEPRFHVFGTYKGTTVDGIFFKMRNKIEFDGSLYSPSAAALAAIHSLGGTERISENGWVFWKYIDDNEIEQVIDTVRE